VFLLPPPFSLFPFPQNFYFSFFYSFASSKITLVLIPDSFFLRPRLHSPVSNSIAFPSITLLFCLGGLYRGGRGVRLFFSHCFLTPPPYQDALENWFPRLSCIFLYPPMTDSRLCEEWWGWVFFPSLLFSFFFLVQINPV